MTTFWVILGLVVLCVLLVFLIRRQAKEAGKNEAISEIREQETEIRREVEDTPRSTPSDTVDKLRRGDF